MASITLKAVKYIGLDVHKQTIVIAVAEEGRSPATSFGTIPHDIHRLIQTIQTIAKGHQVVCCYEAGPTGFGLARALGKENIECVVIAPSLVPSKAGDRVKTDRRDACKLAHFLRSGDLTVVSIPDEDDEAVRDLTRQREDAKKAQRVSRHQLAKFMLRYGKSEPEDIKKRWTKKHLEWLTTVKWQNATHQVVWDDYVHTVQENTMRVAQLDEKLIQVVASWKRGPLVMALQALRGIQLVAAASIVAETGNFARFQHPRKYMSYIGVVPGEYSSGDSVRRGAITRSGNAHLRRMLTECAWSYRFKPALSRTIAPRVENASPGVRGIAWKAQQRLHKRYVHLLSSGKNKNKVVTSIARELAGFIWAIAKEEGFVRQAQQPSAAA